MNTLLTFISVPHSLPFFFLGSDGFMFPAFASDNQWAEQARGYSERILFSTSLPFSRQVECEAKKATLQVSVYQRATGTHVANW